MLLTEEQIVEQLAPLISEEDREWIKAFDKKDLPMLHHDVGRFIRNHFKLWERQHEPVIIDGVDHAEDHPDAISMRIIEKYHASLQNN
jgi:hypothetical protein